jgi:hypothetical protein
MKSIIPAIEGTKPMRQHDAVIQTLEKLGGKATLPQLYREVMRIEECEWATKTPFASIRRIVQTRPEIYKIRPGLWALESYRKKMGLNDLRDSNKESQLETHSYYQGVLISLGNLKQFLTYSPQQDKNKVFLDKPLKEVRTLQEIPSYSYKGIVDRSERIDVIWFNQRLMPNSFFEIEHSTEIQNSLARFCDLQDLNVRRFIVADKNRHAEFEQKLGYKSFEDVAKRVRFLDYESLIKQYEAEGIRAGQESIL